MRIQLKSTDYYIVFSEKNELNGCDSKGKEIFILQMKKEKLGEPVETDPSANPSNDWGELLNM